MARVFLSHSSRDNAAAAVLKAWLDEQGFAPAFLDFDKHSGIPAGADWERTLYEQIQRCQALLILQTPNWSASRWCFAEFTQARALGKPIFQVVESDAAAAEKTIAADLQRLDLRRDRAEGLLQLRRELEAIALQDQGGFPWPPPDDRGRAPFPGLLAFEAEDAPVFFGRDDDWRAVIERLTMRRVHGGPRLLALQGPSGAGKSSVLRAGVLPRLQRAGRQWLVLPVMRPQGRPLEALAQVLAVGLQRPADWRELHQRLCSVGAGTELVDMLSGLVADLRQAAGAPDAQILLSIDQGEELFTLAEAQECERCLQVLALMLQASLPCQAVMTIRADLIGALQARSELVRSLETLSIGPLLVEYYREIIEGPARVAGLRVEQAFVARAIQDTAMENALPLLAYALRQLHDRHGASGCLSLRSYQDLGDPVAGLSPLENAVRQAADGVLQAHRPDAASLKALRQAFVPAMVRVSDQGRYARRVADWESLPSAAWPLLEALVRARLLVRRQGEGTASTVEVAHEALLRVWPLLRGWLDESFDFLLGCQQLEQDLAQWQKASPADQPRALLSGLKLAKAGAWLAEWGEQLRPELRTYIRLSQRREQRQRRKVLGSAVTAFALISTAATVAYVQLRQSQEAQFEATHRALIAADPFQSVVYGLAAAQSLFDDSRHWHALRLSQSLQAALAANLARTAPILTGQHDVTSLLRLRNGEVVTGGDDGTMRRWRDGRPVGDGAPIQTGQGVIWSLVELNNGELISGGSDGTLRRWRDGKPVGDGQPIQTGQKEIWSLVALKNGELISGGIDGTLRRWRDGKPVGDGRPIQTGQKQIWSLIQLSNGEVISGGKDGTLRRWRDGKPVGDGQPIKTGQRMIWSLIELKNGELISGGDDGSLRRWRDGQPVGDGQPIRTGQEGILSLVQLRTGELISGGKDGTLRRWRDGKPVGGDRPIQTYQGKVRGLKMLNNGELISSGGDGTLRIWDAPTADAGVGVLHAAKGQIFRLVQLSNGEIISADSDGLLRRWRDGKPVGDGQPIQTGQGEILSLLALRNGEVISGGRDGTLRRWRDGRPVADGRPIQTHQGPVLSLLELRNGEVISGGADGGTLRRWRDGRPVGDGQPIRTGHDEVLSLLELKNGELISGGADGALRRWRDGQPVGDGRPIATGQVDVLSLIQLRNGEMISGGSDGTLRRWRDGKPVGDGRAIPTGQGEVRMLLELRNGELISAGINGTLLRWSDGKPIGSGRPIATGQGSILTMLELKNGELISGGGDGTLQRLSPLLIVRAACREVDLNFIPRLPELPPVLEAARATCRTVAHKR